MASVYAPLRSRLPPRIGGAHETASSLPAGFRRPRRRLKRRRRAEFCAREDPTPPLLFEELKSRLSEVWSSAPWERVAPQLAPVHEHLLRALRPAPGLRWLDVATGTGAVAMLAARAGADVTGVDLAPGLIETARRLAGEEGLAIRFETGDAEALPVEDASFDVVSSSMGLIFAPDHAAVARELARVTAPGARIAFSAWYAHSCFRPVTLKYTPPPKPGQGDSDDWADREYVEKMLGDAFELSFEE